MLLASRSRRRGLTLADLLITVLILGILASIAVPNYYGALARYRADAAANRIKADLNLVRRHAISRSTTLTTQFSPANEDYVVPGLPHLDHPGKAYAVNLSQPPYNAQIVSASLGGDTHVQYDLHGRPDSGGTITVQSGSYTQTVTIDPDTGRAQVP